MNVDQAINKSGLKILIDDVKPKWLLRMECDSFIMVINRITGEYMNWYKKDFGNPNALKIIYSVLDKHKSIKEVYEDGV